MSGISESPLDFCQYPINIEFLSRYVRDVNTLEQALEDRRLIGNEFGTREVKPGIPGPVDM